MKYTFQFIASTIAFFWIVSSCNSLIPDDKLEPGTYHASGIQVETRYPWPYTGSGDEVILSRDTSDVEFSFVVERIKGKRDSVYFKGLEGANAGKWGMLPASCSYPAYCAAYARLSRNHLEFNLEAPGGRYWGNGQVQPGAIKLDTQFSYRGIKVDYDLVAIKVKE